MAAALKAAGITYLVLNPRNARVYLERKVPTALVDPVLLPRRRFEAELGEFGRLTSELAEPVGRVDGREVYRLR